MNNTRRTVARGAVAATLVALVVAFGAAPAGAWAHPPTIDIKILSDGKVQRNYEIDVNALCRWQYGSQARAKLLGQSWRDWRCTVGASTRSVNFTGYCRAKYGHGRAGNVVSATHRSTGSWTAVTWRCRVVSPRIA